MIYVQIPIILIMNENVTQLSCFQGKLYPPCRTCAVQNISEMEKEKLFGVRDWQEA